MHIARKMPDYRDLQHILSRQAIFNHIINCDAYHSSQHYCSQSKTHRVPEFRRFDCTGIQLNCKV
jgi:hypothetical protein